jgi:hypothetical protein
LDKYLESRVSETDAPLFVTRLKTLAIYQICQRPLKQALASLPEQKKFVFIPDKLRHTLMKKVANKQGVYFA